MTQAQDNAGQFIPLQYYTIITKLSAILITFGLVGFTWYMTKLTRNVLLHTALSISLTDTLPKVYASRSKLKHASQYLVLFLVLVAIPLSSLDVLLNLNADVYISVGDADQFSKQ